MSSKRSLIKRESNLNFFGIKRKARFEDTSDILQDFVDEYKEAE